MQTVSSAAEMPLLKEKPPLPWLEFCPVAQFAHGLFTLSENLKQYRPPLSPGSSKQRHSLGHHPRGHSLAAHS